MDRLPNELLEQVIQHLARRDLKECHLASRQFHVLLNPVFWRHLVISNKTIFHHLQQILTLHPSNGQHVQHAKFNVLCDLALNDQTLSVCTKHMPNLVVFELQASNLTNAGLAQLAHDCPLLASVTIKKGHITSMDMLCHLNELRELALVDCRFIGEGLFSCLPTSLTKLTIHWHYTKPASAGTKVEPIAYLPQLTELTIMYAYYDLSHCLTMTWPHLTCLQLHPCPRLTDDTAIAFIQRHPHLVTLDLIKVMLTDATLDAVATYLPGILHLGLIGKNNTVTSRGLRQLVQRCTDLVKVKIGARNLLADDFLEKRICYGPCGRVVMLNPPDFIAMQLNAPN